MAATPGSPPAWVKLPLPTPRMVMFALTEYALISTFGVIAAKSLAELIWASRSLAPLYAEMPWEPW